MNDFSSSVLREKFTIMEIGGTTPSIVALSNRFALNLTNSEGHLIERVIVRGQVLHTVVRLAELILQAFNSTGPLFRTHHIPIDWDHLWQSAAGPHERQFNPDLWAAVYHNGRVVWQTGSHHSFLDVIEQCESKNSRNYEDSLRVAEDMFNKAGRPMSIAHDTNIAVTFQIINHTGKCGVILRGARKTTTFSFSGENADPSLKTLNPAHFISAAAAFLEGIQLSFLIGTNNERMRAGIITPHSEDGLITTSARTRMIEIAGTISIFENTYDVHYRPEKPNFTELITHAEGVARKKLEAIEHR